MRSIRDLVRQERYADMRAQFEEGSARPENKTYYPIVRELYAGWQRSQNLLVLHAHETGQPVMALSRVFEAANG